MGAEAMYAVMRHYTGASALADAMIQRKDEVTQIINTVPGFRAYYALRTSDGKVATITICDDQAGTQESSRRAAAWVRDNLSGVSISPPEVIEGETYLNF